MGIDLDALANELRAAGGNVRVSESMLCLELPYDLMAPLKTVVVVHDNGAVTLSMDEQGRPRSTVYVDQKLNAALAIIARHFGAGHPVAADRAALVERVKAGIEMFLGDWLDASYGPYDQLAHLSVSAVEAAGWGPRAEPPEPLSAGDVQDFGRFLFDCYQKDLQSEGFSAGDEECDYAPDPWRRRARAVLAALPARFAVPVEGA